MNKSFTLIEILVVIVIVGILSAFIIVSMAGVSSRATIAKGQAFSSSLKNSLMMNLVSEWKMDGNADDAWGSNNGTLVGPTHLPVAKSGSDCVSGGCYQFDGTEDYINCGTDISLNIINSLTIELWIRPNILTGERGIVVKRIANVSSPYVFLQRNDRVSFNYYGLDSAWHIYYSDYGLTNNWQHIAVIFSPATNKAYFFRNGIGFGVRDTVSSGISQPTYPVIIGWDAGYTYFDGFIDGVRIYNSAISFNKIKQNYYSGLNKLLAHNGLDVVEYKKRIAELPLNLTVNE